MKAEATGAAAGAQSRGVVAPPAAAVDSRIHRQVGRGKRSAGRVQVAERGRFFLVSALLVFVVRSSASLPRAGRRSAEAAAIRNCGMDAPVYLRLIIQPMNAPTTKPNANVAAMVSTG